MKSNKLIHCSFDLVKEFVPRVPDSRVMFKGIEYEDHTTPRICVAPSVLHCLKAMPKAGEIIRWMRAVGIKPVVHAYYMESENVHICTKEDVIDADITHEMWILDKPKNVHRVDYEITSCVMEDSKDMFGKDGVVIHGVDLKRVPYKDSLKNLIEGLGLEYGDFLNRFKFLTFREFAMNINCTDELRRKREKHLRHKAFESLQRRVETYRRENDTRRSDSKY